jgi:hypothetical protein
MMMHELANVKFIQYSNQFEDNVPRRYREKKSAVIIQNQGDNGPFRYAATNIIYDVREHVSSESL